MPPLRFAIIEPNILAGLGLKHLLGDIMPVAEIDVFTTFGEFSAGAGEYIHYFVASRIYFEQAAFFRSRPHRYIVLVSGDMQISGAVTLNVCQTEQTLAKSILQLMSAGHHGNTQAPQPMRSKEAPQLLSPREAEVAILLTKSLINKEIAERLNISVTTVVSHRKNIMEKLHARSLADITIYCVVNGLVDISDI